MSLSDPIADLLTRVRNAVRANHNTVDVPVSQLKVEVCRVLKEEGFISDYVMRDEPMPGVIHIALKYTPQRESVLQGLRRVSKPSLRVYARSRAMKPVRSGLGISIVSTSRGVMTGKNAQRERIGGEVICEVW